MAEETYDLWCLCEQRDETKQVSIPPTKDVYDLKELIHQELALLRFNPAELDLIKVHDLIKVNEDCNENRSVVLDGPYQPNPDDVPLRAIETISKVWPTKPSSGCVNVYVRLPNLWRTNRRRAVDEPDFFQRSKIFRTAPSEMGKLSEYRALQKSDLRILDDRPEQDLVPPPPLLYEGFGHFLDTFRRRDEVPKQTKWRRALEMAVNYFAEDMTAIFETGDERKKIGLTALNEILSLEFDEMDWERGSSEGIPRRRDDSGPGYYTLEAASVDSSDVHSDGHCNGPHGAISCIVSFKNELVDVHSMPLVELTTLVARSHAQSMKSHKKLYKGWRVPCLGLTIVGPYVTFYALIYFPNRQLRVVSLTPALSCIASASDGDDRMALYAAFDGALNLLRRIDDDAKFFVRRPPKIFHTDSKFPYVDVLPKYGAPGEKVNFMMYWLNPEGRSNQFMYVAKILDGSESGEQKLVMVKFARQYSIALHSFCAERGYAPAVRGFEQIPGGWFVVAMDLIMPFVTPSVSHSLPRLLDKWTEELQDLVQSFHDAGFVHGDLREPNILCDGEKLKLIDFDFGGVAGEACYPHARLCRPLRDGRKGTDPKITKDDDKRILQDTLAGLKEKASDMSR